MTKHLADHREASDGGRVKHFTSIDRANTGASLWQSLWQRPHDRSDSNRRMIEYLRIARGRRA